MSIRALRTIKSHHPYYSKQDCRDEANYYIKLISKKYKNGIEKGYFVVPGYEHVTKYQPVIIYNKEVKEFQLSTITKFK